MNFFLSAIVAAIVFFLAISLFTRSVPGEELDDDMDERYDERKWFS